MATTEVTIRRTGYIIVIDGTQASVTFHPRDKDKTYSAIIEKCIQLDRAFWKGGNELEYLKRDIDVQLTGI